LGEPTLNFLGLSYGTEIGAIYAALFPHRVGRMVLDGNLEHSLDERTMVLDESHAYEVELRRWGAWCDHATSCPLARRSTPSWSTARCPNPAPWSTTDRFRSHGLGSVSTGSTTGVLSSASRRREMRGQDPTQRLA
jgi:pimeloyl-ACP methyl ester carboxylesterase